MEITQFWATFAGASVVATLILALPLSRGRVRVIGISQRDFPLFRGPQSPFGDARLQASARRAFGGGRSVWVVLAFGLLSASAQVAWAAAVPGGLQVHSALTAGIRAAVCVTSAFWVTSRLIVAAIHRHAVNTEDEPFAA
jgi:hypothetical protein